MTGRSSLALLADQSLLLHADRDCWPLVQPWVPLNSHEASEEEIGRARITVTPLNNRKHESRPAGSPVLQLGRVEARIAGAGESALLLGATRSEAAIDLNSLDARLYLDVAAEPQVLEDAYSMLTICSALLLGRMGRALVHAAAVAAPDGRSWLIVGDGGSGKSTTCVGLATSGYELLSDDQVVLGRTGKQLTVEGWLRALHMDEGWERGIPTGQRRTVEPSEFELTVARHGGMLAGTLYTSIRADEPTVVLPAPAAEAFTLLVRQSPWLLADREAAESVVALLADTARLPRYTLSLGLDTYGGGPKLRQLLDSVLS